MKLQQTTDSQQSKPASAPVDADQTWTNPIYPTIPEYLASSSSMNMTSTQPFQPQPQQPQQYQQTQYVMTPIYVMPQHPNVMYPVSAHGNVMLVPNNRVAYITPQQQQQMYNNYQTQVITPQQQQPQQSQYQQYQPQQTQQQTQPTPEEEKPYFVHELNRHSDTLMKLALRYHCHEEDIKMLNSLLCDDLDLYEGKSLLIPKCDPSLIKKNYDLEDTKIQTERQRQLMVTTFSKNNKITIDEAKVYLEMNDWNSRRAQEELIQDQNWEKQTTGSVKNPSDFKQPQAKTYRATPTSQNHTLSRRAVGNDRFSQYGFEMMTYER